jgi:hypothetical protein
MALITFLVTKKVINAIQHQVGVGSVDIRSRALNIQQKIEIAFRYY